jgi:hypothetical protein
MGLLVVKNSEYVLLALGFKELIKQVVRFKTLEESPTFPCRFIISCNLPKPVLQPECHVYIILA